MRATTVASTGSRRSSPARSPKTRAALGADGVAYALTSRDTPILSGPSTQDIVALSPELRPLWRMTIETSQLKRGAALSDDGVLHVFAEPGYVWGATGPQPSASQLIAIQTTSPGPAKTSWPATRGDQFTGHWLPD